MKRKLASGQMAKESIELKVSLPSGRRETVAVPKSGTIADLKIAAQQSFRQPFLRLAAPDGCLLDPTESLCGFQDGDSFTAVAQQPKIAATRVAFALWCAGGNRIITWGHPNYGDSLTALESEIGSGMCSRSVAQHELLLPFWDRSNCGDLGPSRIWWWQFRSPRSVQRRLVFRSKRSILNDQCSKPWLVEISIQRIVIPNIG